MVTKQQLIDLIQEILNNKPMIYDENKKNDVCFFCSSERIFNFSNTDFIINHSNSCWITRANKLLSEIK